MRRIIFFVSAALLFASAAVYAQNKNSASAKEIFQKALEFGSAGESIIYLKKAVSQINSSAEKRALLAFLGSLQEQISAYQDAAFSYAQAAGIASGDVEGLPKVSNPQLVFDAVRCALCSGDNITAENYLNSSIRNFSDENIQASIKLYEVWSLLCKTETKQQFEEAVALLKTYATLSSMKSVKPQILLTLWYVTGETSFANSLKSEFPKSPEAAIVSGKVQMMPAPFWYFMPKSGEPLESSKRYVAEQQTPKIEQNVPSSNGGGNATKLQLGLFKNKANADVLCDKLKASGFSPYIMEETRSSGITYFIVIVNENNEGTMSQQLKRAGFDCYPVF